MDKETFVKGRLEQISSVINEKYRSELDIGVVAGISGMAMFQFHYAKFLDVDKYSDYGSEMISYCIEKINSGYSLPTYCSGIAGLAWCIQYLESEGFIELNCDNLLSQFDQYLYEQMLRDFEKGRYDFLHGALGYGFYFLQRYKFTRDDILRKRYRAYLSDTLKNLERLSEEKDGNLRWKSVLDIEKRNEGYNLSLSHGMSSILNFLSRLYRIDHFSDAVENLVTGCVDFMLAQKGSDEHSLSLFPSWVEEGATPEYNSRLAWCYGDLGIGLSLLHAGKSLNNTFLQKRAAEIISHTSTRKSFDRTRVFDAGVCHGSFGNALIYNELSKATGDRSLEKSFNFWIGDGIQRSVHGDGYAGFKQWNPLEEDWKPELSLLEGVAGIGLVMIDYLSNVNGTWSECLLVR